MVSIPLKVMLPSLCLLAGMPILLANCSSGAKRSDSRSSTSPEDDSPIGIEESDESVSVDVKTSGSTTVVVDNGQVIVSQADGSDAKTADLNEKNLVIVTHEGSDKIDLDIKNGLGRITVRDDGTGASDEDRLSVTFADQAKVQLTLAAEALTIDNQKFVVDSRGFEVVEHVSIAADLVIGQAEAEALSVQGAKDPPLVVASQAGANVMIRSTYPSVNLIVDAKGALDIGDIECACSLQIGSGGSITVE